MRRFEVEGRHRGKVVGVLSGGLSSEREIADRSARAVAAALRSRGYRALEIDVDRDVATELRRRAVEVVFIGLHGRYGEDGCIQGLLEILGLPYTGTGVMGSALAMDKWASRQVLAAAGLPVAPGTLLSGDRAALELPCDLPVVVKPRGEGSTNGVSLVRDAAFLEGAVALARRYDDDVLIEQYVPGREVTIAILDDVALAAMEVVPLGDEFHTYEVKYTPGRERFLLPAPLGELYDPILELARATHRALFAGSYSRVDLRVRPDGQAFILECNTLPGLHELGWFTAMAAHAGIEFADLVELLLDRARLHVRETRREESP
jgi:D-alanine-D-alanine ligase